MSDTTAVLPPLTQWRYTSVFEGIWGFCYLDEASNVTCGVGFLIRQEADLERLIWDPHLAAARQDFRTLQDEIPGKGPLYYRRKTHARLTMDTMRSEFTRRVAQFDRLLTRERLLASDTPNAARIGIIDMAYSLGVAGLLVKFPRFSAAAAKHDWRECAAECERGGVQPERNVATRTLFLSIG